MQKKKKKKKKKKRALADLKIYIKTIHLQIIYRSTEFGIK